MKQINTNTAPQQINSNIEATERNNLIHAVFSPLLSAFRRNKHSSSPLFSLVTPGGETPAEGLQGGLTRCTAGTIRLATDYGIFDVDETILANTQKYIHDEIGARFHRSLEKMLHDALKKSAQVTCPYERSRLVKEIMQDWDKDYRSMFAGNKELKVCEGMCRVAKQKLKDLYGIKIKLDARYMKRLSHAVVEDLFKEYGEKIQLVPGVEKLIQSLKLSGASLAICTSSPEAIIKYLLKNKFKGWDNYFSRELYDAIKKKGDKDFSASALKKTCQRKRLNCHPSQTVMFGDSMSDLGTAVKGGAALVVIRVPRAEGMSDEVYHKEIDTFERKYNEFAAKNPRQAARCAVLVVQDFSQVESVTRRSFNQTDEQVELDPAA